MLVPFLVPCKFGKEQMWEGRVGSRIGGRRGRRGQVKKGVRKNRDTLRFQNAFPCLPHLSRPGRFLPPPPNVHQQPLAASVFCSGSMS